MQAMKYKEAAFEYRGKDILPITERCLDPEYQKKLDGNYEEGTFMSGQIAGMLRELRPCEDILKGMTAEAEELLKNAYKRFE